MKQNLFNPSEIKDSVLLGVLTESHKQSVDLLKTKFECDDKEVAKMLAEKGVTAWVDKQELEQLLTSIAGKFAYASVLPQHALRVDYPDNLGWFQLNIDVAGELLNRFKSDLQFEPGKHTFDNNSCKKKNIYPKSPLPAEYWSTLKPFELAECFDSLEEFENDPHNLQCRNNLETAKRALQQIKDNYKGKDRDFKIKNHYNMVNLWQGHVNSWDAARRVVIGIDYPELVAYRRKQAEIAAQHEKERLEQEEADNNEAIVKIHGYGSRYSSARLKTYRLFKKYDVEPTDDNDVYRCLVIADEINDCECHKMTRWGNDLKGIDKYIQWHEIELKDVTSKYSNDYLKKDGSLKKLSYRQTTIAAGISSTIRGLESTIKFIESNKKEISQFIFLNSNNHE